MVVLAMLSAGIVASGCPSDKGGGDAGTITAVKATACGYFVNVGLFGGPQQLRGCGQPANAPPAAASPTVSLPPEGSAAPMSANDADGAAGVYGPATIFGGRWPCEDKGIDSDGDGNPGNCTVTAPPSGPMTVTVTGTPAGGTVTSSATIVRHPVPVTMGCYSGYGPNCSSPGGFGPFPVEGDEVHVSCSASRESVTGSTRFVKAEHANTTDAEGSPKDFENIPDNPPPNYTRSGVISNVGDVFTAVYNEQIVNPDGSLTVNGVHMYLFGPTAVGEVVKGQATCGVTPSPLPTNDTTPPSCGPLVVEPVGPENPTPKVPRKELVGVFDPGGIEKVTNIKVTNGTVDVGSPSGLPYLQLRPGQTSPLPITATRTPEAERANLPLEWSFDVTDKAGNNAQCPMARAATPAGGSVLTPASGGGATSGAGATTTSAAGGATTTSRPVGASTTSGSTSTTRPASTTTT